MPIQSRQDRHQRVPILLTAQFDEIQVLYNFIQVDMYLFFFQFRGYIFVFMEYYIRQSQITKYIARIQELYMITKYISRIQQLYILPDPLKPQIIAYYDSDTKDIFFDKVNMGWYRDKQDRIRDRSSLLRATHQRTLCS